MTLSTTLISSLTSQAKSSPRLRVAYDLRTHSTSSGQAKPEDNSQRILECKDGKYEPLGEEDVRKI